MTRTIVVTGSASGIGQAVVQRLLAQGDRVIGIDLHHAEVTADLAGPMPTSPSTRSARVWCTRR